ncbi:MAG: hypothetical protein AB7P03_24175 [Kofleriaceae bacterium]
MAPTLRGAALADSAGVVRDEIGQLDAPAVCAAVRAALPILADACDRLALGTLKGWCFSSGGTAIYGIRISDGIVAVVGEGNNRVDVLLRKMSNEVR